MRVGEVSITKASLLGITASPLREAYCNYESLGT